MHSPTWDRIWIGAQLATVDSEVGIGHITDGALAIKNDHIAWVGTCAELAALRWSANDTIDARGLWITPGLIDCHTHLVYAGSRSEEFAARQQGASYQDIARGGGGILSTVRATREASALSLLQQSLPRACTLLREGVTTLEIKSGYGLDLETEIKMLQVARQIGQTLGITVHTTFLGAHTVPPEFAGNPDAYIDQICSRTLPHIAALGLADTVDVFCERIAFTVAQTRRVLEQATELGLPLRLHADQLSDSGGAALAAEFGALSADHLEHANERSLECMAQHGIVAGILPGAFYYLKETKRPPIDRLRALGVAMAVATDCNPGTSPMTSILLAMNMACVLFGLSPEEALRGVTCNAARALGLAHDRGRLQAGLRADLAIWRLEHVHQLAADIGMHRPVEVIAGGRHVQPAD